MMHRVVDWTPLGRSLLLALVGSLMCTAGACDAAGGADATVRDGLYLGDYVSFRVAAGEVHELRFTGIECRVPHPENQLVSLCLLRAPGLPSGSLPLQGASLSGELEGVVLDGELGEELATGTWTFTASCFDGTPCTAAGEWAASFTEETGGKPSPTDDGTDDGTTGPTSGVSPVLDPQAGTDRGTTGSGDPMPIPDPSAPPQIPDDASVDQSDAADYLAGIRELVGLAMPVQTSGINAAAQAHADYYASHVADYQAAGLNPHSENADWPDGYTGTSIGERLSFQGVSGGSGWGEVMAFSGSVQGGIDGWMETLYHRVPLVHPNTEHWGFGMAVGLPANCEVIDYTSGAAVLPGPSLWPIDDAYGVPTSWGGWESPQPPLPEGVTYPSGPIITLVFENGTNPQLSTAVLLGPGGHDVPAQVQSPANDSHLTTTWSIYSHDPLASQTEYTVEFEGVVSGQPYSRSWSFTTW